jgi:hypothetical protein
MHRPTLDRVANPLVFLLLEHKIWDPYLIEFPLGKNPRTLGESGWLGSVLLEWVSGHSSSWLSHRYPYDVLQRGPLPGVIG